MSVNFKENGELVPVSGGSGNVPTFEYISEGLTFNNCTYSTGGYFKIGNLVFVNIRVVSTIKSVNAEVGMEIDGLPIGQVGGAWSFGTYNTATARRYEKCYGFINSTGRLIGRLSNVEVGDNISIYGWYLI